MAATREGSTSARRAAAPAEACPRRVSSAPQPVSSASAASSSAAAGLNQCFSMFHTWPRQSEKDAKLVQKLGQL